MYIRFLLYLFLIYLLYRLIFHFIIPIYRTSKQVKDQFKDMHGRMQEHMKQQEQGSQPVNDLKKDQPEVKHGDYIDFEEVK